VATSSSEPLHAAAGEQAARWEAPTILPAAGAHPAQASNDTAPPTVAELDRIEEAAFQEGYQHGYDVGFQKGSADAGERVNRLKDIFHTLVQPLADLDSEVEQTLLKIASAVAARIVRAELSTQPELIGNMIHEAVESVAGAESNVTVYLNPDDAVFVREHLDQPVEGPHWKLMPDDGLQPGDCRVETADARADARLDARVERLVAPAFR